MDVRSEHNSKVVKYAFMAREYPDHFHDFQPLRQKAVAKLVERLRPRPGREDKAGRAVDYTLGLYATVMTGGAG